MAVKEITLGFEDIKRMGFEGLLTHDRFVKAIDSNDKNALRDLFFEVINTLRDNGVKFKDYYYGEYIPLSVEPFDMFEYKCIKEIVNLFGYKTKDMQTNKGKERFNGDWIGVYKIYNDNIEVEMYAEMTMHNRLISLFVDTKEAKYKLM